MKDDVTSKSLSISIAVLLIAVLGWSAVVTLFDAPEYTTTTENFQGLHTQVLFFNRQNLIPDSESVFNETSGIIDPDGGTNYTIDYEAGTIQINTTSGYMVNDSAYTMEFDFGEIDFSVVTISKMLFGVIFFIVIVIIILNHIGIKIEK